MTGQHRKTTGDLRRFGLAFGGGLTVLGSLLQFWRHSPAGPYVLAAAGVVLAAGLIWPPLLRPLEWLLSTIFRAVAAAVTYVVLFVAFFLILTPLGVILRLLGKDLLAMKPAPEQATFWVPVEPDGPTSRPQKPY